MPLFGPPNIQKLEAKRDLRALIKALENKDAAIRWQAVAALGRLQDRTAVNALIRALQDPEKAIRKEAALSLGALGSTPAVFTSLQTALLDDTMPVRRAAASALQSFAWKPQHSPAGAMFAICTGEWESLSDFGTAAVQPLLFTLQYGTPQEQAHAATTLAMQQEASAATLMRQILPTATDPSLREALLNALGMLADPLAVPLLADALADPTLPETARWVAEQAMQNITDPQALPALVDAVKNPNSWVHTAAAQALTRIGKPALPALLQAFNDGCRAQVAELLVELAERFREAGIKSRVVEKLITELNEDNDLACQAALMLGRLGDARAIDPLLNLLRNKTVDPATARYASEAVGRIAHLPMLERLLDRIHFGEYDERLQAARELTRYYHEAELTPLARRIILAHQPILARPHTDQASIREERRVHEDTGIGIDL